MWVTRTIHLPEDRHTGQRVVGIEPMDTVPGGGVGGISKCAGCSLIKFVGIHSLSESAVVESNKGFVEQLVRLEQEML